MLILNTLVRWHLQHHFRKIEPYLSNPVAAQEQQFQYLMEAAKDTEWGLRYNFAALRQRQAAFSERVPLSEYDDLKPDIQRMMQGESDVLWHGQIKYFSKSSGTTADKSKFIPVSEEHLSRCLYRGGHDAMSFWYREHPDTHLLANGKGLVMGGSHTTLPEYPQAMVGDVSALMLEFMPAYAQIFHTPSLNISLLSEWEEKLERMAHAVINENVTNMSGVPTWTLVLFRKILEITGKSNILEVFPNFELYMHGGVSFAPYRKQFESFLPSEKVRYREIYNASEGFFAAQLSDADDDILLLLDNGIYYEFVALEDLFTSKNPRTYTVADVEVGKNYALVISTNSGLWRYLVGDTVRITSLKPFKIKVSGRTKQFINAFGEEVMVENTDRALAETCQSFNVLVKDYTVAPIYMTEEGKGGHEWLIEFEQAPDNAAAFAELLDKNLQAVNSDYEAKRYKSLALAPLALRIMPNETFSKWLKYKGKSGGQHKVPRLANNRQYIDEIIDFAKASV